MEKFDNYIQRPESVITREGSLEHLFTFEDFPVFMGCTDQPLKDDLVADMVWEIDPLTGLIQLSKLIPMDILYMDQHMDATGQTWADYNAALSDFIIENKKGNILEIGGGSGKLAKHILEKDSVVEYTVVEPNPTFEPDQRLKLIRSFFSEEIKGIDQSIETIVLSQVLEHVYDPEFFLNEVRHCLPVGGKFLFGYPNLEYLFSNKFTNAINFEHTMLMTDHFVDFFLKKAGFKILKKIDYQNHSHFYAVEKLPGDQIEHPALPISRYDHYKKMFRDYISYHQSMVSALNDEIDNAGSEVFLFGAHIFSQYLFAFGLKTQKIKFILDNSPIKQGKRLYGSQLFVRSPEVLASIEGPTVILKAGLYNKEIMNDILKNINPSTKFI